MFGEQDLKSLLEFQSPYPVLSVYVSTDPTEKGVEPMRRRLRALLREIDGRAERDVEAVERYFEHGFSGTGRSVAAFSSAPAGYFRAFSFQIAIRSRIRLMPRPYVKPLADLMNAYGGCGVALVDRQGMRLFHFQLGELIGRRDVSGEEVHRPKGGGASAGPGRKEGKAGQTRREEELTLRNMRRFAEDAGEFFQAAHVRRILLAGTEENLSLFRGCLAPSWQASVSGTFAASMATRPAQVLAKALEVGAQAEQERVARLVETAVTAAAKAKGGAIGLDDTLGALHGGRVQVLLVSDGYRESGFECSGCGFHTAQSVRVCPFCGNSFRLIEDAVEHAVQTVMLAEGEVEIIRGNPELEKAGRIAAILRY
ncbi:MAG: hypothetical protein ABSG98_09765 [Anaerolineales bacterium]|jgi:rubrerythrin